MNDNHLYIKVGICVTPPFLLFDKLFKVISTLSHVTCCNLNPLGFKNQAKFSVVTVCFRSLFILKLMLLKNMFSTFDIFVGCVTICPSFTSSYMSLEFLRLSATSKTPVRWTGQCLGLGPRV